MSCFPVNLPRIFSHFHHIIVLLIKNNKEVIQVPGGASLPLSYLTGSPRVNTQLKQPCHLTTELPFIPFHIS